MSDDKRNLEQVLAAAEQQHVTLPPTSQWPGHAARVAAASEFVTRVFTARPDFLGELLDSGELAAPYPSHETMMRRVDACLEDVGDKEQLGARLRNVRNREMARIAWRDIAGLADLEETLRDLSALADAAIDGALGRLDAWQRERRGIPLDAEGNPLRLVVFALGKLGARELNFSSDVDLIFAYPADGEARSGRRPISAHEYFLQLGRALIEVLQKRTEFGIVYRVDMRLRPFGGAGALAMNFPSMEDYYQRHGRDWERYALIRMRPVAGDIAAGQRLLKVLDPFVYKRYMDFGTLESLREMKAMIAEEVTRRQLDDHVKLGPGGIRELEFTTQAFQLVRGGQIPELRSPRVGEVLDQLRQKGLMPAYAVDGLKAAYGFLRRSENLLQEFDDRQTHTLPSEPDQRKTLARCMGFESWDGYLLALQAHRAHVREQFDQVLGGAGPEGNIDPTGSLLMSTQDEESLDGTLAALGFEDAAAARELLVRLRDSFERRRMDEPGERRLKRLLPDLLRAVAATGNPLQTLERVLGVVSKILRRSTYLALLQERILAVSHLVRLCAASPWVSRQIADQPQLLDELLDARTLYSPPGRAELHADMERRLARVEAGDVEREMGALRQFKHRQVLRVAAADISGALPLMKVSDHLTDIAEVVVGAALNLARRDIEARHGVPAGAHGNAAQLIVVAYGKLGGIELGYGSDLDLVFIHGESSTSTSGPKVVDSQVYFARLAQRTVHYLATPTSDGTLYEVDTRLRPHGKDGVIACSLAAFEAYQRDQAWTWEHQALVRARCVAGDADLAREFACVRRRILLLPRDPELLRQEVRAMRERMRSQLGSRGGESFNLKQDPGGITDIEFMVQYAALRWGTALGRHLDYTDNIRLLEGLERCGVLPGHEASALADAYRALRAQTHRLALQELPAVQAGEGSSEVRELVTRIWQSLMADPAGER